MTQRSAINIGAIIAAITAAFQFLPQLMQILQQLGPFIEQLKTLFSQNTPSMTTFGAAAGVLGYQGYAAYRSRGVAKGQLNKNNNAFAQVLTELSAMDGPESEAAVEYVTKAMALQAKAGAGALRKEAEAAKAATPDTVRKEIEEIRGVLGEVVLAVRDIAKPRDVEKRDTAIKVTEDGTIITP